MLLKTSDQLLFNDVLKTVDNRWKWTRLIKSQPLQLTMREGSQGVFVRRIRRMSLGRQVRVRAGGSSFHAFHRVVASTFRKQLNKENEVAATSVF
jgi:hypothetical protein